MALIGITALCAVEDTLQLQSGETILIQGGAGGVASFAIQLARHIGACVITTASAALAPPRADVASLRPNVGRDRAYLDRTAALVASGAVRVPEITIYALADAAAAHKVSEGRHFRGKLVFKVR